ncbi:DUF1289 domain-containing protein [Colwellia sp. D2M02]|uniref:DUF1289 domain-containing protein n=1 Tax=Colwellia sp. D2M02 TaxID=2841562 RepID=UPI001C08C4B0|nr:DUF1289 domain-containing protein [Colwellia sp. D2M02]MBU2894412.1 DUF1289 domain-containing protein [Colwellia sp. D2M02]
MQLEFFDVPSPCVGICQADDKGHCIGCMRTRDERLNWSSFNHDDKQKVIKRCQQRKKRKAGAAKVKVVEQEVAKSPQPSLLDPPAKSNQANSSIANDDSLDFSDFDL